MRRGDIGHIKRRVLAHQDHIEYRKVPANRLSDREMVTYRVAKRQRPADSFRPAVGKRQAVGKIIVQFMAAVLGLKPEGETRVAADVDGFDRVHLDGNAKRHVPGSSPAGRCEA